MNKDKLAIGLPVMMKRNMKNAYITINGDGGSILSIDEANIELTY